MSKEYKLNKSELTRLKREEKLYGQYLPVLKLKQEQLQREHNRIKKELALINDELKKINARIAPFTKLFVDKNVPALNDLTCIHTIKTKFKTIAGLKIKIFESIEFAEVDLKDFYTPPWIFTALPLLKEFLSINAKTLLMEKEASIVNKELKKATQKVNLFEMVLIPKTKEAIRRIKIFLGDEQVASVSRGKIAKSKKILEPELV